VLQEQVVRVFNVLPQQAILSKQRITASYDVRIPALTFLASTALCASAAPANRAKNRSTVRDIVLAIFLNGMLKLPNIALLEAVGINEAYALLRVSVSALSGLTS
jgi:hypothetical protein